LTRLLLVLMVVSIVVISALAVTACYQYFLH
jgi:hypothetical protein